MQKSTLHKLIKHPFKCSKSLKCDNTFLFDYSFTF